MTETEARQWYESIQSGEGVDRDVLPESQRGGIAQRLWDDPTFTYGIEYGVLIALTTIFNLNKDTHD